MSEALDSKERIHHPYSPSTLQAREACPCYAPRVSKHVRAIAGTLAHKVVETGIDELGLSDEDAMAAAECVDFVAQRRQLMEEARLRAIASLVPGLEAAIPVSKPNAEQTEALIASRFPDLIEQREVYLPIDDCVFEDCDCTTGGFVDHVLIDHARTYAEMFDYKFGVWAVEDADNNLQGFAYALGLFRKYPTLQRIKFWFKQPLLNLVSSAEFTRDNVATMYLRVSTVVARARSAKQSGSWDAATPTVPICMFCDNLGRCPKVAEFACTVARKFSPLQFPESITPTSAQDPANTLLGLQLAQVMKVWADAFRRQVTDRVLRRDAELPEGYAIQARDGNRHISDMDKFKSVALRYVTEAEFNSTVESSLTAIEKIVADKAPRGVKKATLEQFQADLIQAGCVARTEGYSFLKAVSSSKQNT